MRVTIIPSDQVMLVDGRAIHGIDLTDLPPNVHAVQWDGEAGHVEFNDGSPNQAIKNLADFHPWVQRWYAARAVEDAPPPPKTPEQIVAEYTAALDRHIDSVAKAKGYDNRVTASLRAAYAGPWQAEGAAFAAWMDACYLQGQAAMAAVMAGQRPLPTVEEFLAELPVMTWPA